MADHPQDELTDIWTRAVMGERDAQFDLGEYYFYDKRHADHYRKAFRWYRCAASQGHPEAHMALGVCYHNGAGVKENQKEAFRHFLMADKLGCDGACYWLAYCFQTGCGVEKNFSQALTYVEKFNPPVSAEFIRRLRAELQSPSTPAFPKANNRIVSESMTEITNASDLNEVSRARKYKKFVADLTRREKQFLKGTRGAAPVRIAKAFHNKSRDYHL